MNHLTAIIDRLSQLGDVYYRDAIKYGDDDEKTDLDYPYWIVWPTDTRPGTEIALDDNASDITATIGVTSVGITPEAAGYAAQAARLLLGARTWQPLNVPDRKAVIRWQSQAGGAVDRDVVLPETGRHPAYEVDFYRLESTPT